jgi:cytochrome P450
MARSWTSQGAAGTKDTVADTATLALHVLTSVGFGLTYPFHGGVRNLSPGHRMTYRDALSLCLRNIIIFTIFGKKILSSSFLPQKLRTLGVATEEFQKYMEEMLAHERQSAANREKGTGNLIGALVRASEEAQRSGDKVDLAYLGFSDEEIFGNIFAFNLAGHETTANTIATAIVLMAAKPEYQKWISEEIDGCLLEWAYEATFYKLQRCLAVMVHSSLILLLTKSLLTQNSTRHYVYTAL